MSNPCDCIHVKLKETEAKSFQTEGEYSATTLKKKLMGFLSTKACKSIQVVTQSKIMKHHHTCALNLYIIIHLLGKIDETF